MPFTFLNWVYTSLKAVFTFFVFKTSCSKKKKKKKETKKNDLNGEYPFSTYINHATKRIKRNKKDLRTNTVPNDLNRSRDVAAVVVADNDCG